MTDTKRMGMFSAATFQFFRELQRNNSKAWMDRHRERYRQHVVVPFRALFERLMPEVLRWNPQFDVSGRTGSNFSRINRDLRFSRDKTPYRTHMYLLFSRGPKADDGQLYVNVGSDLVTVGFRIYGDRRRSTLARLGAARAQEHPAWIRRQQRRLGQRYESYWYTMERGEWTKHPGWPVRPEDWKQLRGWVVRRVLRPADALQPDFDRQVARIFRALYPLYEFTSSERWQK
ncbi:MAG: DUF2461 domain-containing protein [Acidobacteriia bacterium]|jgi:uncharacterized protein (TIGR02453 family)|nr:DUF2461 domain-containing protein [Terriglobia bacterium]